MSHPACSSGCLSGFSPRCHCRQMRALVRMWIFPSNAKMADDGIDAFTRHAQPSSVLRQPRLDPCDRSAAQPGHFRKFAPCVQRYDLGKKRHAIGAAPYDERCIRCVRDELNDPVRQIRSGKDGDALCFCHLSNLILNVVGRGILNRFQVCSQPDLTASDHITRDN